MKKIINVSGMHCAHCAKAVEDAVSAIMEKIEKVAVEKEKDVMTV